MINFQLFWQRRGVLNILLLPLAAVFSAGAALRRYWLLKRQTTTPTHPPVIIIGNIVVGGGGKTPVVIALARQLAARGWRPGIISRGYGGNYCDNTLLVEDDSDWRQCGDEPLLIRHCTQLPMCVGRQRRCAAERLAAAGCNVIISDDGLQHYALARTLEICVIDAAYRFGNGWRLPAGPLREGVARAEQCDIRLLIGGNGSDGMTPVAKTIRGIYALAAPQQLYHADFFSGKTTTALAGIARPDDFFQTLEKIGIKIDEKKPLADHSTTALNNIRSDIILMTEKDAVKYDATDPRLYALAIDYSLPDSVIQQVEKKLVQP